MPYSQKLILKIDFATPVLLQQLLQSMVDPGSARTHAVTYAMLSLIVRLVASQTAVFNLWFSRRCYERSRGEMILMFTEKILQRKHAGADSQPANSKNSSVPGSEVHPDHRRLKSKLLRVCELIGLGSRKKLTFSSHSPQEKAPPASLGKILNIMRHVWLASC